MAKVLETNTIYDSNGKSHTWDMCEGDGDYYFTLDNIRLDWSFPKICYGSAKRHYDLVISNEMDVDWSLEN